MTLNDATQGSTASTIGAVVLGVLLVIPAYFVGGILAAVYMFFAGIGLERYGGGGGSWIPFLDGIFTVFWFYVLPDGIRGVSGTGLSLLVAHWAFKRADARTSVFTVTGIWVTIGLLLIALTLYVSGPDMSHFGLVGTVVGFLIGGGAFLSSRD